MVVAGAAYSCALLTDGTVECWGNNDHGRLGNGTTTRSLLPVPVTGITTATAISSGNDHTCVLLVGGTIDCWGGNQAGRLVGTTADRLAPIAVSGITGATAISAGGAHTCAVLGDGTIVCWGNNQFGQLGQPEYSTISSLVPGPYQESRLPPQSPLADCETCALLADGTIDCWGSNARGQLGNGTTTDSLAPVAVSGITDATELSAGDVTNCALVGASVECWGYGEDGELGNEPIPPGGIPPDDGSTPVYVLGFASPPDAPTGALAVPADASVMVAWIAPDSDGGTPITGYTVLSTPDGKTCTTAGAVFCTVSGLTNGTAYRFTVTATNSVNTGPASATSNSATPATSPAAPTGVSAVADIASAEVSWSAPGTDGGMPITGYTAMSSPEDKTCTTTGPLSCTVFGLTNGTSYTFTVTATNAVDTGPASLASDPVIPMAIAPAAPTGVAAIPEPSSAQVSWVAPGSDGGSPITRYTVTSSPDGKTCITSGTLSCAVSGLTDGTGYTFTVTATNAVDTGPPSVASASVTPLAGATYVSLSPTRLLDTRFANGLTGPFLSGTARTFQVTGRGGVSGDAVAVTGNLTVTGETSGGYVELGPVATNSPTSSSLNFPKGDTRGNSVTVGLSDLGSLSATFIGTHGATTALIFDVTGYFAPGPTGATYVSLSPTRLLDTRFANGLTGPFLSGTARTFQVTGRGGVSGDAVAVTGNLTVTGETSGGYVELGPVATNSPTSSSLNFPKGDTRGNSVTVGLSNSGSLSATFIGTHGATTTVINHAAGFRLTRWRAR